MVLPGAKPSRDGTLEIVGISADREPAFASSRPTDSNLVMPGLVPGMTSLNSPGKKDVDGRDKPGHDEKENLFQVDRKNLKIPDAFPVMLQR